MCIVNLNTLSLFLAVNCTHTHRADKITENVTAQRYCLQTQKYGSLVISDNFVIIVRAIR